jgi:hypothetical protein
MAELGLYQGIICVHRYLSCGSKILLLLYFFSLRGKLGANRSFPVWLFLRKVYSPMSSFKFRFYVKPLSSVAQSDLLDLLAKSPMAGTSCEPCYIEVYFKIITDVYLVPVEVLDQFVQLPSARESRAYSQAYGRTILPLASYAKMVERSSGHAMS